MSSGSSIDSGVSLGVNRGGGGGGSGAVDSVNSQTGPVRITSDDGSVSISAGNGDIDLSVQTISNITVTANQISDATTVGKALIRAATTAAAQDAIGGTVVGKALFQATTTAAAQDTLGGTTFGKAIFQAPTTAAAQDLLEAGTVGLQIFKANTTAAVNNIVGTGFTGSATNVDFTPGSLIHVSATNVQTAINQLDAAVDRVSAASIGGTAIGKGIFTAPTTAAAQNLLEAGAVGLQVFKSTTTAAAQNALGGTTFGKAFFQAATTADAQNLLEAGTVGLQIFKAATTAAVANIVGAGGGSFTGSATNIDFAPGTLVHVSGTNVQTAINQLDAALERVSAASIGGTTIGKAIFTAPTTAAVQNLLEAGTVGLQIFKAATTAAVTNIVGAGFSGSAANVDFTPGSLIHVSANNVQTAINQLDAAVDRVSAASIGGTAIGKGIFTAPTTAAAQNLLEAGAVGLQVFKTATTAAAQNALGGTVVGKALFQAATTADAQNSIGGTTFGKAIFQAATTAAAQNLLEAGTVGLQIFKCNTTAAVTNITGTGGGGGGTPGGANTYVQFNDSGSFGGEADFKYAKAVPGVSFGQLSLNGASVSLSGYNTTIEPFTITLVDGVGNQATINPNSFYITDGANTLSMAATEILVNTPFLTDNSNRAATTEFVRKISLPYAMVMPFYTAY